MRAGTLAWIIPLLFGAVTSTAEPLRCPPTSELRTAWGRPTCGDPEDSDLQGVEFDVSHLGGRVPTPADPRFEALSFQWCEKRAHGLHGPLRVEYPNRSPATVGAYREGVPDGEWTSWYADGRVAWHGHYAASSTGAWRDEHGFDRKEKFSQHRQPTWNLTTPPGGPREGLWEFFYEDGTLRLREFLVEGEWDGIREAWYRGETRRFREAFERGWPLRRERWHETGQLAFLAEWEPWKDGKSVVTETDFFLDGAPRFRQKWEKVLDPRSNWPRNASGGRVFDQEHFDKEREAELQHGGRYENTLQNWMRAGSPGAPEIVPATFWDFLGSAFRNRLGLGVDCAAGTRARERLTVAGWTERGCVDAHESKQGPWTGAYRNGPWYEHVYVDGRRSGPQREWWESGELAYEGSYAEGQPDGDFVYRNWLGTPVVRGSHTRGQPSGTWEIRLQAVGEHPIATLEFAAPGELLRWEILRKQGGWLERGAVLGEGLYRVERFHRDSYNGDKWIVIEARVQLEQSRRLDHSGVVDPITSPYRIAKEWPYAESAELPSGDRLELPTPGVLLTGPVLERQAHDVDGLIVARGRYVDGLREGEWEFPLCRKSREYSKGRPLSKGADRVVR